MNDSGAPGSAWARAESGADDENAQPDEHECHDHAQPEAAEIGRADPQVSGVDRPGLGSGQIALGEG